MASKGYETHSEEKMCRVDIGVTKKRERLLIRVRFSGDKPKKLQRKRERIDMLLRKVEGMF